MFKLSKSVLFCSVIMYNALAFTYQQDPLLQASIGILVTIGVGVGVHELCQYQNRCRMKALSLDTTVALLHEEMKLAKTYLSDYDMYEAKSSDFHILINNRFIQHPSPIKQYKRELWELVEAFDYYYSILMYKRSHTQDTVTIAYCDTIIKDLSLMRRKIIIWYLVVLRSPAYKETELPFWKIIAIAALSFIAGYSLDSYIEEQR